MSAVGSMLGLQMNPNHRGRDSAMATPVEEICGSVTPIKTSRRITKKTPTSGQENPTSMLVYTELRGENRAKVSDETFPYQPIPICKNLRQLFGREQFCGGAARAPRRGAAR